MFLDKVKLLLIVYMSSIFYLNVEVNAENSSNVIEFKEVRMLSSPLEEWNSPGQYSPLNLFDENIMTCCAEGFEGDLWAVTINLVEMITVDEIRIVNGYAKSEELFRKNNRLADFNLTIYNPKSNRTDDNNIVFEKKNNLKDSMLVQIIKLNTAQKLKLFDLYCTDVYPGSQWDDTCVSEIEFYCKGKKIEIKSIEIEREKYLKQIENDLNVFFKYKYFEIFMTDMTFAKVEINNSVFKYTYINEGSKNWEYPIKYKVENLHLYFYKKSKWILVNYNLNRHWKIERLYVNKIVTAPHGEVNFFIIPCE